jgi:hypothetical protein
MPNCSLVDGTVTQAALKCQHNPSQLKGESGMHQSKFVYRNASFSLNISIKFHLIRFKIVAT